MPTGALFRHVCDSKPDFVGLSISFAQQLSFVKDVIARLKLSLGSAKPPVIVGGLAVNGFPQLADIVGADAHCGSPEAAVEYANQHSACPDADALVSR